MSAPGSPDPRKTTINGSTYTIREKDGALEHIVVSTGRDLREEWDFRSGSLGMGETTRVTETGYYFTDNIDATGRGLRLGPTITVVSTNVLWPTASSGLLNGRAWWFEEVDTSDVEYLYLTVKTGTTNIRTHKITLSTMAVISGASQPFDETVDASNSPGRPERFNGSWFRCEAGQSATTRAIQRLTTVNTGTGADTWTPYSTTDNVNMLLRESVSDSTKATVQRLYRAQSVNKVQTVNSDAGSPEGAPLVAASWAPIPGYPVGEGTTIYAVVVDGVSHAGMTLLAKQDGLFAFDPSGNSYNILEFLQKGNLRTYMADSGKYTVSFGEIVIYPHATGLYLVTNMRKIQRAGPDAIGTAPGSRIKYTSVPNITAPRNFRHYEVTSHSHWIWFVYADSTNNNNSYIFAAQIGPHPQSNNALILHTVVKRANEVRDVYIDSDQKLVWGEPGQNRFCYMQLGNDGSPDSSLRGNVSSTYKYVASETDFGEPEITKQGRYIFVETEGGVSTCSWQLSQYRDSGSQETLAAFTAITTAAATNLNWTMGTTDTFRRWRWDVVATTTGAYSTSSDPKILRVIVYARSADRVRVVLIPDENSRNLFEMTKVLRKLKDAGPISVREPGTNESTSVYIRSVNQIAGAVPGVQIEYDRFAVSA